MADVHVLTLLEHIANQRSLWCSLCALYIYIYSDDVLLVGIVRSLCQSSGTFLQMVCPCLGQRCIGTCILLPSCASLIIQCHDIDMLNLLL